MRKHCTKKGIDCSIEVWKDIPGYEGLYQASNWGRVKSLARMRVSKGGCLCPVRERILIPNARPSSSYLDLGLSKDGVSERFILHELILLTFVGPRPRAKMHARHFPDKDIRNNRLDNLQWGTAKENYADRAVHGTDAIGERNPKAKVTEAEVRKIRTMYSSGKYSQGELGLLFNVNQTQISMIVLRRNWKHVK